MTKVKFKITCMEIAVLTESADFDEVYTRLYKLAKAKDINIVFTLNDIHVIVRKDISLAKGLAYLEWLKIKRPIKRIYRREK